MQSYAEANGDRIRVENQRARMRGCPAATVEPVARIRESTNRTFWTAGIGAALGEVLSLTFIRQLPEVANMPIAASAMTAVASQPGTDNDFVEVKVSRDHFAGRQARDHRHDRHPRDAVNDGAPYQGLDRIERGEIEPGADHDRRCDCGVESGHLRRTLRQADAPAKGFADGVATLPPGTGTASMPAPTIPNAKIVEAKGPAIGRNASAA
jgi:hypothetical protein